MKKISFLLLIALVSQTFAQTTEKPARAVTDPGVVTTRQTITPAGVQSVFDGRVYGVTFGAKANELFVLTARGRTAQAQLIHLDWQANRVLQRIPLKETPGLQGLRFDAANRQPLFSATMPANQQNRTTAVRLLSFSSDATQVIADVLGTNIAGALAVATKPNAKQQRLAVVPLIYNNQLAVIDLNANKLLGKVTTGIAPFGAAINADGTIAYVTNWGGRTPKPGELTAPTGLDANADQVVVDERGIAATGTVIVQSRSLSARTFGAVT